VNYRTLPVGSYSGFTATEGTLTWADGEADPKIIQVNLNPSALSVGQEGTFQVELYGATNAALESGAGAPASSVTASINVFASAATQPAPPPPTPPGVSKPKGGGAMSAGWLLMLLCLAGFAAITSRRRC